MSFTELLDTDYGKMLVPKYDPGQSGTLRHTRKALSHKEIDMLIPYLKKLEGQGVFLDVGANVGCFSFALRPYCSRVYAYEAQRIVYYMLAGSIALNGWDNVFAYHMAIGHKGNAVSDIPVVYLEIPQFDYSKEFSVGSVEFGNEQREWIGQTRQPDSHDLVLLEELDTFCFPRVDVVKIDVEGMELSVLRGAANTIVEYHPVMLIECLKTSSEAIANFIHSLPGKRYEIVNVGMDLLCT